MPHDVRDESGRILRMLAADNHGSPSRRVFLLGGLHESRLNLPAQQHRALNLIWALVQRGHLRAAGSPTRVVVIGAGVAGATAAAAAVRMGAEVLLVDEHEEPVTVQRAATQRYLHPTLFDWPLGTTYPDCAGLPLLNWTAAYADNVRNQLLAGLLRVAHGRQLPVGRRALTWVPQAIVNRVKEDKNDVAVNYYLLQDICEGRRSVFCQARADIVIVAAGFLPERRVVGSATGNYWKDDCLELLDGECVIVGDGDGALTELFRVGLEGAINGQAWYQQNLRALAGAGATQLEAQVRNIEHELRDDMNASYLKPLEAPGSPLDALDGLIRARPGRSIKVVTNRSPLRRNSFAINRFVAARAQRDAHITFVEAQLTESDAAELSASDIVVVWRTGPPRRDQDLVRPFFDVNGLVRAVGDSASQTRAAGLTAEVLDETRRACAWNYTSPTGGTPLNPIEAMDRLREPIRRMPVVAGSARGVRWRHGSKPAGITAIPKSFGASTWAGATGGPTRPAPPWPEHYPRIASTAVLLASIAWLCRAVGVWWCDYRDYPDLKISLDLLALASDLSASAIALTIAAAGGPMLTLTAGSPPSAFAGGEQLADRVWVKVRPHLGQGLLWSQREIADALAVARAPATWWEMTIAESEDGAGDGNAEIFSAGEKYQRQVSEVEAAMAFPGSQEKMEESLTNGFRLGLVALEGLTRGGHPNSMVALSVLRDALVQARDRSDRQRFEEDRQLTEVTAAVFTRAVASQDPGLVRAALVIFGLTVSEIETTSPLARWVWTTLVNVRAAGAERSMGFIGDQLVRASVADLRPSNWRSEALAPVDRQPLALNLPQLRSAVRALQLMDITDSDFLRELGAPTGDESTIDPKQRERLRGMYGLIRLSYAGLAVDDDLVQVVDDLDDDQP